ncbi:MAG: hypothetical protein M1812_007266 [Candelaria pacifica]|nr:MAG: hypothetical protein M1812_007266 [Candelaria pacifica]
MGSVGVKKQLKIAVVGGGIGGVVTTIALLRQGIKVDLYEATQDYRELGGGIIFGPNTVRIMEKIDPRMLSAYELCATHNAWESKRDIWWEFRHGIMEKDENGKEQEPKLIAGPVAPGIGHASARRPHVLAEWVKLLPKGVTHFGKRLDAAQDVGDDGVLMHFTDGTMAHADAVIGCDGIKSQLRKAVLGKDDPAAYPAFTGKYAWRGLMPMEKAVEAMGEEYALNAQMFCGEHTHVFTLPLEKGTMLQMVTTATMPDKKWNHEKWVVPAEQDELFKALDGWVSPVRNLLPLIKPTEIWALFDHPPARTYTNDSRICLLGDAAHASTPHQGSGGGMAMEDAFMLSSLLANVTDPVELSAAFKAYDAIRRPRSQRLVTSSREAGEVYQLERTALGDDAALKENLENRYKWIWNSNPDQELAEGQAILAKNLGAAVGTPIACL